MSAKKQIKETNVVIPDAENDEREHELMSDKPAPTETPKKTRKPRDPNKTPAGYKVCVNADCGKEIWVRAKECEFCKTAQPPKPAKVKHRKVVEETKDKIETITSQRQAKIALLNVLRGRNFNFKVASDPCDPNSEIVISGNVEVQRIMDIINFAPIDDNPKGLVCTGTNPKIQFSLDLDTLLGLMKIKERN